MYVIQIRVLPYSRRENVLVTLRPRFLVHNYGREKEIKR